ncbi:MAG: DUF4412 domain-containing protein [Thermodesulfobacteriota bacterium]|nr:DUF4412 domain-containing protein [Thermodesulfobacteriota bacterium]
MFIGKRWWVLCLIAMSVMLMSAGSAYAGKIKNFSADQVTLAPNGKIQNKGKIYITPEKIRTEMLSPQGKGNMIMIMRRDLNLYWMLNPGDKKYFERPLNEKEWESMAKGAIKSKTEKDLGTETINGFKCRKKSVEMVVEVMGFKSKSRSVVWISKKLDMPIRTKMEDGNVTELRNIKKGRQSKKLFEIPGGYKKVGNMMETFAGSGEESGGGVSLPKGLGDKLKGFKLPFGD